MSDRFVYVIGVDDCPVKIGVSWNPKDRLGKLQAGCPHLLRIHYMAQVPNRSAHPIESAVHRLLSDKHRHLEWYDVTVAEAKAAILSVAPDVVQAYNIVVHHDYDLCAGLRKKYPRKLNKWAAMASDYYLRCLSEDTEISRTIVARMNSAIIKQCGVVSYNLFKLVAVDRKHLSDLVGLGDQINRNAELGLIRTLNVLGDYFDERVRKVTLDKIYRNAA